MKQISAERYLLGYVSLQHEATYMQEDISVCISLCNVRLNFRRKIFT